MSKEPKISSQKNTNKWERMLNIRIIKEMEIDTSHLIR